MKSLKRFKQKLRRLDWKSILIGNLLAILILSCFGFFVFPEIVKSPEIDKSPNRRLQDAVDACPYLPNEYQESIFDCSNMANMLDDWLEQKYKYETFIIMFQGTQGVGHAMVIANGVFIEPTTKRIVYTFNKEQYAELSAFGIIMIDDVERLIEIYGEELYQQEWSYPKRW